jgi:hypothetical protein
MVHRYSTEISQSKTEISQYKTEISQMVSNSNGSPMPVVPPPSEIGPWIEEMSVSN